MTEPLLATRFYPPVLRSGVVERAGLFARLGEGLQPGKRLILVSAPAGYGKSTLVSTWYRCLPEDTRKVWLTLDVEENETQHFLTYLVAAMNRLISAAVPLDSGSLPFSITSIDSAFRGILIPLLNELSSTEIPKILIMDDYQAIHNHSVHTILEFIMQHMPPSMRVVIVSRADPPLQLASMRASGQICEVRLRDLKFSLSETNQFMHDCMDLQLKPEDLEILLNRTEGWIAGLQMVGLSLRDRANPSLFIRDFSGSHRYILEYLIEEILERQSEPVQNFLLFTSVLDQLCAPLCDALLDTQGESQTLLRHLERANLFLIPLDDDGIWFRYHSLFADLLKGRLQHKDPKKVNELLGRAARWYMAQQKPVEAIDYALAAREDLFAAEIIESMIRSMLYYSDRFAIHRWLKRLPDPLIRSRPWLSAAQAYVFAILGETSSFEDYLLNAENANKNSLNPDTNLSGLLAGIRALIAEKSGDLVGARAYLQTAERHISPESPIWLFPFTLGGDLQFLQGNLDQAEASWSSVLREAQRTGHHEYQIRHLCSLARVNQLRGRLIAAVDLLQQASQLASETGQSRLLARTLTCLAAIHTDQYQISTAEKEISKAMRLYREHESEEIIYAMVNQTRIHLIRGDPEANRWHQEAARILHRQQVYMDLLGDWNRSQVLLWLTHGEIQAALRWAEQIGGCNQESPRLDYNGELEQLLVARIWLDDRIVDSQFASQAEQLMARLIPAMERANHGLRLVEALVLQSLARKMLGDLASAAQSLQCALQHAAPAQIVLPFIQTGSNLLSLLIEAKLGPQETIFLDAIRALIKPDCIPDQRREQVCLPEPLSERELEVLQAICQGLSNQEIADRLFISLNTVKRHASNIFAKLSVENRAQAILTAQKLGLDLNRNTLNE